MQKGRSLSSTELSTELRGMTPYDNLGEIDLVFFSSEIEDREAAVRVCWK